WIWRLNFPIQEFGWDGIPLYTCAIIGNARVFRPFFDPAETAIIQRIDEDVSRIGVSRNSAPVGTADIARKIESGARWRIRRAIRPRCVRAAVDHAAAFFNKVAASCRMSLRTVSCSDEVFRLVVVRPQRRRRHREGLRWRSKFAGNVTLRHPALFNAKDLFSRQTIENEDESELSSLNERGNLLSLYCDIH